MDPLCVAEIAREISVVIAMTALETGALWKPEMDACIVRCGVKAFRVTYHVGRFRVRLPEMFALLQTETVIPFYASSNQFQVMALLTNI